MIKIDIKPKSINECYTGQRFKTKDFRAYTKELLYRLSPVKLPDPPFEVYYEFGFSNMGADIDNPVKPFQDILQKKYGFNDKLIHRMVVAKHKVPKGKEYIIFSIKHYISKQNV